MWQPWQVDFLAESWRRDVPMWAIEQEFGMTENQVQAKLARLRYQGVIGARDIGYGKAG